MSLSACTISCPRCGATNDDYLELCTTCDSPLDPQAPLQLSQTTPRALNLRGLGIAAGVASVLLLLMSLMGWSTTMTVLPGQASNSEVSSRLSALVVAEQVESADAIAIQRELAGERALWAQLDAGNFEPSQAASIRERLSLRDQSVILAIGGWLGLLPPLFVCLLAGIVVAVVLRVRRVKEVGLGAAAGVLVQALLWSVAVDFDLSAVFSGRLVMLGGGPDFVGAPAMLLGAVLLLSVGLAAISTTLTVLLLPELTGIGACSNCMYRFSVRPKRPAACPECRVDLGGSTGPAYRADDAFITQLGGPDETTARFPMGATELLCLTCAKTYASARCPTHPHETMLDPRQDAVRFRMLELDSEGATQRFSAWTQGLGTEGVSTEVATDGPRLCMQCAATYDSAQCAVHPDEPLLDPTLEAVRHELVEADGRARRQMSTRLMFAGVAASLGIGFAVTLLLGNTEVTVMVTAGGMAGLVAVANVIAPRLSPARFSQWTGEAAVDLNEFGMGSEATIFAPLRRALRRAVDRAVTLAIATVATAVVSAGIAAMLEWSIGAFAVVGAVAGLLASAAIASVVDGAKELHSTARSVQQQWR